MYQKYSFKNDYSEGAHPKILEAITRTNLEQTAGYGEDKYSLEACALIREQIQKPEADIHFVSGGTQANLTVIASFLKPYESIIAADTSHIFVHEAGAIEATGHKINAVPTQNGKLTTAMIQQELDFHEDEHMVKPKAVFISNSTELGSIYSKQELTELSTFCRKNDLFLYLDGARLGSALTSNRNDLTLAEVADLVDIFYIGGTKHGLLFGEAIVITRAELKSHFRFYLKQKGALLAKGRILGIQFLTLFQENLFFEIGRHANQTASELSIGLKNQNYDFLSEPMSNQIFPIFSIKLAQKLHQTYGFYDWKKLDKNNIAVRLVTSWATPQKVIHEFLVDMISLKVEA